jgi:hypothetical protein
MNLTKNVQSAEKLYIQSMACKKTSLKRNEYELQQNTFF